MTGPGTYWRTLRHLKRRQITGRLALRLPAPRPDQRPAPPLRPASGRWELPARRMASLVPPRTLDFLHERHSLDDIGWDNPSVAKLWRYNQHYFDDLNAHGAPLRRAAHLELVDRWIADTVPGHGTGWEPYPVSLRIVNWIKWAMSSQPLTQAALGSLATQTRWLARRLEWHLLGNHLFANAKALVFAGLLFAGDEAEGWLRNGARILQAELVEQILDDGGQFERSPMYHALAFEDVIDLIDVLNVFGAETAELARLKDALARRVAPMARWLRLMSADDGTPTHFNDSAAGIAPANDELLRLAAALGFDVTASAAREVEHLAASGYVRVARPPMVAWLDTAPVGPDYLPGHAHADTLSFELSLHGRRVIVNGGTSTYGTGARRLHERSTSAHSTVEVEGINSSEVWSGFRVGRRARPGPVEIEHDAQALVVGCSHDGYAHLPGRPRHRRQWRFGAAHLTVDDRIDDTGLGAVARYHLAPGLELNALAENHWRIEGGGVLASVEILEGVARREPSSHSPSFGVVEPSCCLCVQLDRGRSVTRWSWQS